MLDWLIIGGGIHGTYLSLYLTRRRNVSPERLRVLDPYPQPLALWNHFAVNTGMEFLRSSHAHNLHFDPFSLITFTRTQEGQKLARFIEPYGRPSLELFRAHADMLIERYGLGRLRLEGRATRLKLLENGWLVETNNGALEAQRVILAIGNTERPYWPEWAVSLREAGAPIHHIFDPSFRRQDLSPDGHTLVIGGGITAVQTALALATSTTARVTLLMRHPPRVHPFDADTGWITPQYLGGFHSEPDYARRRVMITAARHRGSTPRDVADELSKAVANDLLVHREGEVASARPVAHDDGATTIQLTLSNGHTLTADRVVLATGFDSARPGGAWLDHAVAEYGLPLAPDGYPVVDTALRWSRGLYVTGPLAELEIGPVARNLVGVRLAAECIGGSL